jgi:AAA domain
MARRSSTPPGPDGLGGPKKRRQSHDVPPVPPALPNVPEVRSPPPPPPPPPQSPSPPARCLTAAEMIQVDPEWIVPGWIPQVGVTLVVGPTNVGKTTLFCGLASHVTGGPTIIGASSRPASQVLYYCTEMSPCSMLLPRLRAAEADCTRVMFPGFSAGGILCHRLSLPSELRLLHDEIMRQRAAAVILDPITSMLDATCSRMDPDGVRRLLDSLLLLSETCNVAIVGTLHYRKSRQGTPLDWVAGCAEWTQCVRVVIALGSHPDVKDRYVMAAAKPGLGAPPPSRMYRLERANGTVRIHIGQTVDVDARDLSCESPDVGEQDALADAKAFLIAALDGEPRAAMDLEREWERACLSRSTVRRAKKLLRITSTQVRDPTGSTHWVWGQPEEGWPQ